MKKSAYGKPLLINNGNINTLRKIESIDELTIQDLVYQIPESLPISDIDESYNPVIPVCKELNTPAGAIDIFMITPNGDLVIIETKLWRNPEARRKVVAQILDYAKELANWTYEDLQREVNKRLKTKGNTLYEYSKKASSDLILSESDFVDAVSRNLRIGKFMLLIVGDGIREGAGGIAEFINRAGNLNFNLSMVEYSIYTNELGIKLALPRIIVKTIEIQKINIETAVGLTITNNVDENVSDNESTEDISLELALTRQMHLNFWTELISELEFDDPGQQMPSPSIGNNIYIYPANTKSCWISAYFAQSLKRVGVYFRFQKNNFGKPLKEYLEEYKDEIKSELGKEVIWQWEDEEKSGFVVRLPLEDIYSKENKEKIKDFFKKWLNHFVNVIRPKLKEYNT
ncbi:MAG: DUF4268 domain-containing protein [Saprospiraceae bacterium]|nr:DUF4268 domain-containing protein [Saprospiraceae bacterium]